MPHKKRKGVRKMTEKMKIERYILDNGTQSELIVSDGYTIADIFNKMLEDPYTTGVPTFMFTEPDRMYGIIRTWIADSDPEYLYRVEVIPEADCIWWVENGTV